MREAKLTFIGLISAFAIVLSLSGLRMALAEKKELPPGISKQGRIPGKGSHKGWEQGKHKGWEKNKSEEPGVLKHREKMQAIHKKHKEEMKGMQNKEEKHAMHKKHREEMQAMRKKHKEEMKAMHQARQEE